MIIIFTYFLLVLYTDSSWICTDSFVYKTAATKLIERCKYTEPSVVVYWLYKATFSLEITCRQNFTNGFLLTY